MKHIKRTSDTSVMMKVFTSSTKGDNLLSKNEYEGKPVKILQVMMIELEEALIEFEILNKEVK